MTGARCIVPATIILLAVLLPSRALAQDSDPAAVLMEADRAFARETGERGIEGWMAWFAEEASMNTGGVEIRGHEAIRSAMAPLLADSDLRLEWEPERAVIEGDLGYTVGGYRIVGRDSSTDEIRLLTRGRYLTVWRRQVDGSWKVLEDIGSPAD